MGTQRLGERTWLDVFPFQEELGQNTSADVPLFLDIGGANGHQCVLLKQRFPQLPGRVVLQDTEQVISNAPELEGIEKIAYDAFTPQPIKGKKMPHHKINST